MMNDAQRVGRVNTDVGTAYLKMSEVRLSLEKRVRGYSFKLNISI